MTPRPSPGRVLRLLPLALLAATLAAPWAGAHAVLQSADPPVNGHVDAGVTLVEFRFTEEVEPDYTDADVVDQDGESVKAGAWEYGEKRNVLRLPVQPLGDGIYSARWQALSVDSHTTRGSYVFAVGNATLKFAGPVSAQDPESHDQADITRDGLARAVFYGGLFLVLGVPVFLLVVDRRAPFPRRLLGAAALFGALGASAALLNLMFLAERTGLPLAKAAGTAAGESFVWRTGLLAAGALALLVALLLPPARRRIPALLAIPLGVAALVATALGSHAAADDEMRTLSVTLDVLHLAMGAVWIGGIVAFLHQVWGRDARAVGEMVHRFSPLAVASVVVLLATGTYASFRHIPSLADLWTPYGRLVLAKIVLLGVLVLLGAYNKQVLGPRLKAGTGSPRFFRRVLQGEAILMALVLGAAGILASTPPPDREVQTAEQGPPPYLEFQNYTSHSHVIVQVYPNPVTVGLQRVVIQVHPGPTTPVAVNDSQTMVALKLQPPGGDEPESTLEPGPRLVARGEYEVEGGLFTEEGTWRLIVLLQRTDVGEFTKIGFDVPVVAPGAGEPSSTTS